MHIEEARWIAQKLCNLRKEEISPILNIGSSTGKYRVKLRPFIDSVIFSPLRERGIKIVHQDIKSAEGINLVGDLTDQSFLNHLEKMHFKTILCSNLLEHIENRNKVADVLLKILSNEGYLIVTVPSKYPKHMDPIDTMFRPTINELSNMFYGTKVLDATLIDVGTIWSSLSKNWIGLIKLIVRITMPYYNYKGWSYAYNKMLWMFRQRTISCVFLRKTM